MRTKMITGLLIGAVVFVMLIGFLGFAGVIDIHGSDISFLVPVLALSGVITIIQSRTESDNLLKILQIVFACLFVAGLITMFIPFERSIEVEFVSGILAGIAILVSSTIIYDKKRGNHE